MSSPILSSSGDGSTPGRTGSPASASRSRDFSSRSPMRWFGSSCWTAGRCRPSRARRSRGSRLPPSQSRWEVMGTYVVEGIRHILFGADHLLFVLGLLLIVRNGWMLVKTVTAFTVAHSITLAVATLGYAEAPALPLNAAIALSILFLGPEIVRVWRGETSFTIRHPWVVAFAFGLLHGFGFASAMTSAGLPRQELPLALLSFNVGVELGQLGFVALVLAMERSFRVLEVRWPRWVQALPGYTVGTLGAFWTIQRVAIADRGVAMTPAPSFARSAVAMLAALWAQSALGHVLQGEAYGFVTGFLHPDLRRGPRARDGRRRPVGRAARRTCDLGAAGRVSAGHGDGRHARISRRADPRRGIRDCRFGDRARSRGRLRSAASAGHRGARRRMLRDLPRPCARHRTPARPERIALQHGLRDRDRMPARGGHRHRHRPSLAMGTSNCCAAPARWSRREASSSCGRRSHERRETCCGCVRASIAVLAVALGVRTCRSAPQCNRHGPDLRRPDALSDQPRGSGARAGVGAAGGAARRALRTTGDVHASGGVVAGQPLRIVRCSRQRRHARGIALVPAAGWIGRGRCEALAARR